MTKIDTSKPLQLADGTPARFVRFDIDGDISVELPDGTKRLFNPRTGIHIFGQVPRLMNVPGTVWAGKAIQTRDGKHAVYLADTQDGQTLFEIHYDRNLSGRVYSSPHVAIERRQLDGRVSSTPGVESGDDIVEKVAIRTEYLNIYTDGTIGATRHETLQDAKDRPKYGKIRVGIMSREYHNGILVSAAVTNTPAMLRTRSGATNPFVK